MSVTVKVRLAGTTLDGTWWGEDDPGAKSAVKGELLAPEQVRVSGRRNAEEATTGPWARMPVRVLPRRPSSCSVSLSWCAASPQARAALAAELSSQDTTLLLGLRPQAHRSATKREAEAIADTLTLRVPEASGKGGLAPMSNSRAMADGSSATTVSSGAAAAAAFGTANRSAGSSSSSADSSRGRIGGAGTDGDEADAACSAWHVTFSMPASPDGVESTVSECFAMTILPPGSRVGIGAPGASSSSSSGVPDEAAGGLPVLGQGFNDFGAFIV